MKKLTKKEAYGAMYQGWSKLGADPSLSKCHIPGLQEYDSLCPACEYHVQHRDAPHCPDVCIMRSLWPTDGCKDHRRPYMRWLLADNDDYDRCFFALVIAEEAFWLYKLED